MYFTAGVRKFAVTRRGPSVLSSLLRSRQASTLASFHYLSPLDRYKTQKPYHINVPPDGIPGHETSNEESTICDGIRVHDIRERVRPACIDREGFEFVQACEETERVATALPYAGFAEGGNIVKSYGPAIEGFLQSHLGAEKVYTFGFRVRRRDSQFPKLYRGTSAEVAQPIQGVHADFTPDYARTTATYVGRHHDNLCLQDRRWQLISVWRPLFGPLHDWPLGLLDYTSIDIENDLVAADNVYPHQVAETYHVYHRDTHRWCFVREQQPNELTVFKAFDSARKLGLARLCPHAAFENCDAPSSARRRESIECVSLVLYPRGTAVEEESATRLPSETPSHLPPIGAVSFG